MSRKDSQFLSEFERLILKENDPTGLAVFLILAWITGSDGELDVDERKALSSIAASGNHINCEDLIIKLGVQGNVPAIQLACELIRIRFANEGASLFLEMAIGIAITDRYLRPSENYILRFLADLLGVAKTELNRLFFERTGKQFPDPPDISSNAYWSSRQQTRSTRGSSSAKPNQAIPKNKYEEAHSILGVPAGTAKDEIKTAYRRLAKKHHPDRYHSLGKEAVEAAHVTFSRIQEAYDYLIKYA